MWIQVFIFRKIVIVQPPKGLFSIFMLNRLKGIFIPLRVQDKYPERSGRLNWYEKSVHDY